MTNIKNTTPQRSITLAVLQHSVLIAFVSLVFASVVFRDNYLADLRPTTYLMYVAAVIGILLKFKRKRE